MFHGDGVTILHALQKEGELPVLVALLVTQLMEICWYIQHTGFLRVFEQNGQRWNEWKK